MSKAKRHTEAAGVYEPDKFYQVVLAHSVQLPDIFLPAGATLTLRGDYAEAVSDAVRESAAVDTVEVEQANPSE
jgi:hypothetical protein